MEGIQEERTGLSVGHETGSWLTSRVILALIALVSASNTVAEVAASFALVPPGPVVRGGSVELRLGVENTAEEPVRVRVVFSLRAGESSEMIGEQTIDVPAGGKAIARLWHQIVTEAGPKEYRYEVETPAGSQTGAWSVDVVDGSTRALPYFQGMWIEPLAVLQGAVDTRVETLAGAVKDSVATMDALGVRVLILAYVEYLGHFFYPSDVEFYDNDIQKVSKGKDCVFDMVEAFLAEADARDMHVILGLGRSGDTPLLWEFEMPEWAERNKKAINTATQLADEIQERYGQHKSLYGWYLSHEMNDLGRASAYYDPIARHCHALAPEKVVLVAPSGTPIITPELLEASAVDIFAYQDAVGSGYIPYENTFKPAKRIATLDEIYTKYAAWHAKAQKHFWSDLEIWEMDGSQGYGGPYPTSFSRVKEQIAIESRHAGMLTGYAYHGYLQAPADSREKPVARARDLYAAYTRYLRALALPRGE